MLEALQAEEYREERAHVQLVDGDEEEPVLIPQDQQEDMTDPGFLSSEHFPPKNILVCRVFSKTAWFNPFLTLISLTHLYTSTSL